MNLGSLDVRIRINGIDEFLERIEAAEAFVEEANSIEFDIQSVVKVGAN